MNHFCTLAVLTAIAVSTQGCGAILFGYLVGDAIQRDQAIKTCRANLKITNDERLAQGKDLFPDQCK